MLKISRKLLSISLLALGAAAFMGNANAAGAYWGQEHPRRAQVHDRLETQNHRIDAKLRHGEITRREAGYLHAQAHRIGRQERILANRNGGYLTRGEQHYLNHQENRLSRRIAHM